MHASPLNGRSETPEGPTLQTIIDGVRRHQDVVAKSKAERPRPGGHHAPGTRKRKVAYERLLRENAELRARLELDEPRTPEQWEVSVHPAMRTAMLVDALLDERCDRLRALKRLGIPMPERSYAERVAVADYFFGAPDVLAALKVARAKFEEQREGILTRLEVTALYGTDGDSTRAIEQIARMAGWNESPKPRDEPPEMTLYALLGVPLQVDAERPVPSTYDADDDPPPIVTPETVVEPEQPLSAIERFHRALEKAG